MACMILTWHCTELRSAFMAGFVPDFSAEQGTMCHVFVYWSYGFCLFTSGKRPGQQLIVIQHVKFQIPCLQVYRPVNSTVIQSFKVHYVRS